MTRLPCLNHLFRPHPLQVVVHLTTEGQARWKDVAALVHAHARLVKDLPAEDARRAWQESRDMSAIYLRFQQASTLEFVASQPCSCRVYHVLCASRVSRPVIAVA